MSHIQTHAYCYLIIVIQFLIGIIIDKCNTICGFRFVYDVCNVFYKYSLQWTEQSVNIDLRKGKYEESHEVSRLMIWKIGWPLICAGTNWRALSRYGTRQQEVAHNCLVPLAYTCSIRLNLGWFHNVPLGIIMT